MSKPSLLKIVNPDSVEEAGESTSASGATTTTTTTTDTPSSSSLLSIRVHETHSMQYKEKYKVLHLIQKGGWGAVFAAERNDGRPVAMKFFGYSK